MSKLWPCMLIFLCACCLFASIFLLSAAPKEPAAPQAAYYLRDWGGYLALFEAGRSQPLEIYPVYTHLLPSSDAESLRKGIPLANREDADRLLEDFGG